MKIELNINEHNTTTWPHGLNSGRPMLVRDEEIHAVVIVANDTAIYFHSNNDGIIGNSSVSYLKKHYTFVRYLEPGESVTFTV